MTFRFIVSLTSVLTNITYLLNYLFTCLLTYVFTYRTYFVPHTHNTFGNICFPVSAHHAWISLPADIQFETQLISLSSNLETIMFVIKDHSHLRNKYHPFSNNQKPMYVNGIFTPCLCHEIFLDMVLQSFTKKCNYCYITGTNSKPLMQSVM